VRSERSETSERLFLGVPLTPEARATLRTRLPDSLPGSPVPAENWHVTLRFLGSTPQERRDSLIAELRSASLPRSFAVEFSGIGAFPAARRAKLLWVGVSRGGTELGALARLADAVALRAGFEPQPRPFHPHLTIARTRHGLDATSVVREAFPAPVRMPVTALALFRSRLGSGPPHYEVRELFSLGK